MVSRTALLIAFVALFVVACGGNDADDTPSATATRSPAPRATEAATPAGARITVEPDSGPPGTEVTVRGTGWEPGVLIDVTGELPRGTTADPFESVVSNADGTFTARFRLETAPDGSALSTGRYTLIARSPSNQATVPFLVETRRPVGSSGPSG